MDASKQNGMGRRSDRRGSTIPEAKSSHHQRLISLTVSGHITTYLKSLQLSIAVVTITMRASVFRNLTDTLQHMQGLSLCPADCDQRTTCCLCKQTVTTKFVANNCLLVDSLQYTWRSDPTRTDRKISRGWARDRPKFASMTIENYAYKQITDLFSLSQREQSRHGTQIEVRDSKRRNAESRCTTAYCLGNASHRQTSRDYHLKHA
ncbi:uncharacterized protein B0J16DRAFT_137053 [Fusarium flagelliforme]|uniref:uncharacterized protein n=1 Tax=Fusarium flagelliforme TaxID=2675880 RepID=UPI001E8D2C1F|nr:uncharacterized protein B0J16DRAFT_137053 [Fusarium flagelliforme]KAH7185595.1 hypothetical protein B0J16DRAFT_137053 [Fusarium flagelliforme]